MGGIIKMLLISFLPNSAHLKMPVNRDSRGTERSCGMMDRGRMVNKVEGHPTVAIRVVKDSNRTMATVVSKP